MVETGASHVPYLGVGLVSELGVPELHGGDGHIACPMLGTLHADAPFACNTT